MRVVGVDGYRGGWVAVTWDTDAGSLPVGAYLTFAALRDAYRGVLAIGVDIPIGLSESGPRQCAVAARPVLGPRRASVFPAPDPRLLFEPTYQSAMARSFELTGKYLSQQTFGVGRKVAEVNWAMLGENQDFIFEIHPEVSFWALAGRPMQFRKTWPEGFDERRALLEEALAMPLWSREEARLLAGPAQPDDVLDAVVAAWTARRQADGIAERFPLDPPIDARGLRMEIVY